MHKKVFLDTNVFLDCFLAREPHWKASAKILDMAAHSHIVAFTSSVSFCNVSYILNKLEKSRVVENDLQFLLNIIQIVPNTAQMLGQALLEPLPDYEDCVQYISALKAECNYLITANKKHFLYSKIPVFNASEFVNFI
jgi:predicted nucleic acid-binding protein